MSSISSRVTRKVPQQERAEKRVAALLVVAGEVFAEVGYEAATMTEVAARAGSSIGALYTYFPDKSALAFALLSGYAEDLALELEAWFARVPQGTPAAVADDLLDTMLVFGGARPAYMRLLEAPIRFRRDPGARKALRMAVGAAFRVKNVTLSEEQAFLAANVTLQIVKGMMVTYQDAEVREKEAVVAEFKRVLQGYLGDVLKG